MVSEWTIDQSEHWRIDWPIPQSVLRSSIGQSSMGSRYAVRPRSGEQRMVSHFIWYELLTTDVDASQRFYTAVVGWSVQPSHNAGMDYRHFTAPDGDSVGGMLQLTDQMIAGGARPVWLGY